MSSLPLRPGDEDDADAQWEAYQALWLALLRGEGLPAEEAAELTARRDAWAPVMYDALMRAVCDAVVRLELGYTVVRPDAADAADAAADPVRCGCQLWRAIFSQKQACTYPQRDAAILTRCALLLCEHSIHYQNQLRFMSVSMRNVRPCLSGHELRHATLRLAMPASFLTRTEALCRMRRWVGRQLPHTAPALGWRQ